MMQTERNKSKQVRGRGPGKRLQPEQIAVARALSVHDFAVFYGTSPAIVRGWVGLGMPHLRLGGKIVVLRAEAGEWLERRFRSDRVSKVVDEVLADLHSTHPRRKAS